MTKQLLHPLGFDRERPLLFLKVLLGRLPCRGCLSYKVFDHVRVECVHDPVEEVAIRISEMLFAALWVR